MKLALIGAGSRGAYLASLAKEIDPNIEFVALAEPREGARQNFLQRFPMPQALVTESWEELFEKDFACDAAIIATMDRDHKEPALRAMARGWDLLLEKPMASSWDDCKAIEAAQRRSGRRLAICHSLRYHQAFQKAREIAQAGVLGRLMNIDLLEQVGYWHFAHSFVRGNWRREDESAFVLLAKSCHDMDYLSWLAGRPCLKVSSVGALSHFRREMAPAGAKERCDQDCPVKDCAFDARKIYSPGTPGWDMFVRVRADVMGESLERASAALVAGPFGRCVYHSDNTVADHQSVLLEFEGELNATFSLSAFTNDCARKLRVQGTEGELEMQEVEAGQRLRWRRFGMGKEEELFLPLESGSHGGADFRMVGEWLKSLKGGGDLILSNAQASLESHRIAFAAEVSRKLGRSLSLDAFEELSEKAYA